MSQSPTADATSADAQGAPVSRVVLVTGGNRGIGRTIAQEMLAAGHRVAVTSRNGDAPEGALAVSADVTDADSLDAAFATVEEEYGPVEIVVANAGITADNLLMRMSDDEFSSVIDTNLGGAYRTARRAITNMIRAKHGRIVLISSVSGLYGVAGQANYSSSKAGLVGLARSITREVGSRGITANVVAPGFIRTDMTDELPEKQQKEYLQTIPAKRFAEPEEVAKVVRWIASDEAAYISGAVIPVDGGLGMGH
ncbi:MAG TPA: beta-ketoacyl-ACP reductase [Candidatus Brevibacterium intestinigallinarum]|nr:beta-ketoacyl-ACP reductase [Candidatus Brevibacterium intestinigallinarum]